MNLQSPENESLRPQKMFANIIMATQFPVSYSAQAAMYSNRTASQSAGTYYLQGGPSDTAEVIDGNLRVTGNLQVDGNEVVAGTLTAGGTTVAGLTSTGNVNLTGAASLTVAGSATVTGPVFSGGFTTLGAMNSGSANVTNNLGVSGNSNLNTMNIGAILSGSLLASAPAAVAADTQFTMTIAGWRFVWGKSAGADTGEIFFKNAAGVNTPFSGQPLMLATAEQFSTHGYFDGTVAADRIINLHGTTSANTGYSTYVWWLCIGPA